MIFPLDARKMARDTRVLTHVRANRAPQMQELRTNHEAREAQDCRVHCACVNRDVGYL